MQGLEQGVLEQAIEACVFRAIVMTGPVLDAGDPVKDATVTVAGQSDMTGADGRATITVDKPGRYIARATAPKYVGAQAPLTVRRR